MEIIASSARVPKATTANDWPWYDIVQWRHNDILKLKLSLNLQANYDN